MTRGVFVTFEGGEGAGKSTQTRLLAAALRRRGLTVLATREPGGSPNGERIRTLLLGAEAEPWDPLAEALLHYAARREHMAKLIGPALARGDWVVSDRFADSTLAYQGYGGGGARETIETVHEAVLGGVRPDLTLILDLDPEDGLRRAARRSADRDRYEKRPLAFHRRLRRGFNEIAARDAARCVLIDAAPAESAVSEAVLAALDERLGGRHR